MSSEAMEEYVKVTANNGESVAIYSPIGTNSSASSPEDGEICSENLRKEADLLWDKYVESENQILFMKQKQYRNNRLEELKKQTDLELQKYFEDYSSRRLRTLKDHIDKEITEKFQAHIAVKRAETEKIKEMEFKRITKSAEDLINAEDKKWEKWIAEQTEILRIAAEKRCMEIKTKYENEAKVLLEKASEVGEFINQSSIFSSTKKVNEKPIPTTPIRRQRRASVEELPESSVFPTTVSIKREPSDSSDSEGQQNKRGRT